MIRERKPDADLCGAKILIVEDEYYLATEIAEQVERAGGTVLGPFPDGPASLEQLDADPDCAVVDINLGQGPSFVVAEALQRRGVPFLFLTGYDAATIPPEFAHVERIEKPANTSRVIDTIARLSGVEGRR
jgi:CheY-like chemotaxis protein